MNILKTPPFFTAFLSVGMKIPVSQVQKFLQMEKIKAQYKLSKCLFLNQEYQSQQGKYENVTQLFAKNSLVT